MEDCIGDLTKAKIYKSHFFPSAAKTVMSLLVEYVFPLVQATATSDHLLVLHVPGKGFKH